MEDQPQRADWMWRPWSCRLGASPALVCTLLISFALQGADPAAVETYRLTPEFPKYVTAHVEVRDPSNARWPSLFYGKPAAAGTISISPAHPAAAFKLNCDQRAQKNGDQSRRVLGEVFNTADKAGVVLQINSMSALAADKAGISETTFSGVLELAGKTVPLKGTGRLRVHAGGTSDEKNNALLGEMSFDIKAADLGLKTFAPDAPLQIRASFSAYPPDAGVRKRPG